MKKVWHVFVGASLVVLFLLTYRGYEVSRWNQWVNRVRIAGQAGSDEQVIVQMLGRPSRIVSRQATGAGFLPSPPPYPAAVKTYVYHRVFLGAGGYWAAFIFLDGSGHVVAVHIAES